MSTVTLLAKAYNDSQFKLVQSLLNDKLRGLKAKVEVLGVTSRRWVQVAVSGEDEAVALRYLSEEIGFCPESLSRSQKFTSIKGSIVSMSKNGVGVDVGVFSPKAVDAEVPLSHLQAQLADGKKVAMDKISSLYGLCESLPLTIKILSSDAEAERIEGMLDEKQVAQFRDWTRRLLDVLVVLGASAEEVDSALKRAGSVRDVVAVEPLGLFEFSIVCKLGTDAQGLIPRVGRSLRRARFSIFNPRKLIGFLGDAALEAGVYGGPDRT